VKFKLIRNSSTDICEYEESDKMYCPEGSNVYQEREFLPNLTFYRYSDNSYGMMSVNLAKFKAVRETPCGYWILKFNKEKWIPKNSRKRFCYPTKEEAWHNFKCRKKKQLQILEARVESVKSAIQLIKEIEE
jgi:hypothetical protein